MTDERRKDLEQRLEAAGRAVMRVEDRDTLLATVANLSRQNRELEKRRHELVEEVTLLKLRIERAENALVAIKRFGAEDYAVRHILEQAGVAL